MVEQISSAQKNVPLPGGSPGSPVKAHKVPNEQASGKVHPSLQKGNLVQPERKVDPPVKETNVGQQFSLHKATDRIMVRIYDRSSGELIREIPPHELLDSAARLNKITGLLFGKKV